MRSHLFWSSRHGYAGKPFLKAIQAGATGYLLKERDDFEIMLSIRSILHWWSTH